VSIAAWRTEANPVVRVMLRRFATFSALGVILFSILQWLLKTPLLAIYFYSAIPLALCTVSLAVSTAVVVSRRSKRVSALASVGLAILVVGALRYGARVGAEFRFLLIGSALGIGLVGFGAWRSRSLHFVGTVAALVLASWAAVSAPHDFPASPGGYRSDPAYDGVLFSSDDNSMERAEIVHELSSVLPSLPSYRGELMVWFDSQGPFDQLSAPFVWYRSALQSGIDPPAPEVTATVRSRLLDRRPRYVVIIDGQEADMLRGVEAVVSIAPYHLVWKLPIDSGRTIAHVALMERRAGSWRDFPCDDPASLAPTVCS
jgi:hypothetical protein